jgi:hypothetical protein
LRDFRNVKKFPEIRSILEFLPKSLYDIRGELLYSIPTETGRNDNGSIAI